MSRRRGGELLNKLAMHTPTGGSAVWLGAAWDGLALSGGSGEGGGAPATCGNPPPVFCAFRCMAVSQGQACFALRPLRCLKACLPCSLTHACPHSSGDRAWRWPCPGRFAELGMSGRFSSSGLRSGSPTQRAGLHKPADAGAPRSRRCL